VNIKYLNESFKRLYEADITPKSLNESFATELRDQLNDQAMILSARGNANIKDYEVAFQETIENIEPEKPWWEVTTLNIFWDLFENRDVDGCINRIIDNLKPEYKDKESDISVDEAFFPEDIDDSVEEDLLVRGEDGKLTTTSDPGRWGNSKEWNWNNESLKEALEEALARLNEAEISPEDQADSDLIRSMISKMQDRSNARFTPEEQAVLTKYGITRDNGNRQLLVGDRTLNPKHDGQRGRFYDQSWHSKTFSHGTPSKINYADRARKLGPRKAAQISGDGSRYFYQNRDINAHGRGASYNPSGSLLTAERNHQKAVMGDRVLRMKNALDSRKYAQDTLDAADAKRDSALAAAKRTYDTQVAAAHQNHARSIDNASKSKDYHQKEIDRLLKKDPKE
jgi:hypothetical protein